MHADDGLEERIRRARIALGYTQNDIAEAVGGKLRSWQDYEAGKRVPGSSVIKGLAKLGINANWVLTGEGPMLIQDAERTRDQHPSSHADAPGKISTELAEKLTESMTRNGLIKENWGIHIRRFVSIYNRVAKTPATHKDIDDAVLQFLLDIYHDQVEYANLELARDDLDDELKEKLKALRDYNEGRIKEIQQILELI